MWVSSRGAELGLEYEIHQGCKAGARGSSSSEVLPEKFQDCDIEASMHSIFFLTTTLLGRAFAHSWNEQLTVVENGFFIGNNGYPRGYVSRSDPGFNDDMMTYLLPPLASGRTRVDDSDLVCAPTQRSANQTNGYPRLSASPGVYIAMKYLENGHVTLPQIQPGKPQGAGIVFVFGTSQPTDNDLLTEVLQWTTNGAGGDRRGRLLTAQNFDDGRCYQINDGDVSVARQEEYPNLTPGQPRSVNEQWCETDVLIPTDVPIGPLYTLYWVWQWPTEPGTPGLPDGKDEYYTSCSDLDIVGGPFQGTDSNPLPQQDPQIAAVPNFESRTAFNTDPFART
ncbi:uncharacterized protein A1O5_12671 [Cladophialophora psammophila CBS 110553]|uniref:DUF7492 domain-containing protein n=1 Tax=Cladophialophora psammophila CBS 110553 TaxID=1182543 RepID=W9VT51_9EURO|nr:uncharacterized protein A1O5_12671 [Cladophialophora psammophila CBS 110553]EXJ56215.1 hypothetical protein A1O5_12671 [Cladophialophora psammophila CBS 110553]